MSKVSGSIGVSSETNPDNYRLGSTLLYEEPLPIDAIHAIYVASQTYKGYYQGEYIPSMTPLSDHLLPNYIKLVQNDREQVPTKNVIRSFFNRT